MSILNFISRQESEALQRTPRQAAPGERPEGVALLAKHIGGEAATPAWTDRLYRDKTSGEWLILVCEPRPIADEEHPEAFHDALDARQTFHELGAGARLLRSKHNPELILQRRRELIAAYESERAARLAQQEKARVEERDRASRECAKFGAGEWKSLDLAVQIALSLAYELENTEPGISKALIAVARRADAPGGLAFPSREWWRDLGRRD